LKLPGTKGLKLKYDEQLSNVAFNFNLRRYIKAGPFTITGSMFRSLTGCVERGTVISGRLAIDAGDFKLPGITIVLTQYCMSEQMAGWRRLTLSNPR